MTAGKVEEVTGAEYVYSALLDAGISLVVGIPGVQTLPIDEMVVSGDEIEYVMARHETAIPHIAWGYFEASESPAATVTVPGPGDTNAMHGLKNALNDGVPLLHISADVAPEHRGQRPIHEIDPETYDSVVKANIDVTEQHVLPTAVQRAVSTALTPPLGPVRLGIPSSFFRSKLTNVPSVSVSPEQVTYTTDRLLDRAVDLLRSAERPVVFLGTHARKSTHGRDQNVAAIRKLVTDLNVPVVSSYKGKGVLPEDDPHFLGITASHLAAGARDVLNSADVVLALGPTLDGVTTDKWTLPLGTQLIHVTPDEASIDASYTAALGIPSSVEAAVEGLNQRMSALDIADRWWDGAAISTAVREEFISHVISTDEDVEYDGVSTPMLLRALREELERETIVTTDVGGFSLWAKHVFEAYHPSTHITAGSWSGMGVGLPAAIGAKLARPERAVVSFAGDGSLLMCDQELHTAVECGLDLTVVVFNNGDYGIISKSVDPKSRLERHPFAWESPDFAQIASGMGCHGVSAASVDDAISALRDARSVTDRPTVIDVAIRTDEPSVVEASKYRSEIELDD